MNTWNLHDIHKHPEEIFYLCTQEPQIVCEQNIPVAIVLDFALFKELAEMKSRIVVPTIAEMLDELDNIKMEELAELEIPIRKDRKNQLLSWISDDVSM